MIFRPIFGQYFLKNVILKQFKTTSRRNSSQFELLLKKTDASLRKNLGRNKIDTNFAPYRGPQCNEDRDNKERMECDYKKSRGGKQYHKIPVPSTSSTSTLVEPVPSTSKVAQPTSNVMQTVLCCGLNKDRTARYAKHITECEGDCICKEKQRLQKTPKIVW
mgnify:CR=1 FL=1